MFGDMQSVSCAAKPRSMFSPKRSEGEVNSGGGAPAPSPALGPYPSAARGGDGADQDRAGGDLGAGEGDHFAQAGAVADADAVADDRGAVDADVVAELAAGGEEDRADEGTPVAGGLAAAEALDQLAPPPHPGDARGGGGGGPPPPP